jgi:hypothetical protein
MKDCRARALVFLEVAERTANTDYYKIKVVALAEAWLTFAAIEADEVKRKMH